MHFDGAMLKLDEFFFFPAPNIITPYLAAVGLKPPSCVEFELAAKLEIALFELPKSYFCRAYDSLWLVYSSYCTLDVDFVSS